MSESDGPGFGFERFSQREKYEPAARAAARKYGIPEEEFLRLITQESNWQEPVISGRIKSKAGAIGIAQFMPGTARDFGIDPTDPYASLDAAAKMLRRDWDSLGSWDKAVAAYNWGIGNVQNAVKSLGEKWYSLAPAETVKFLQFINPTTELRSPSLSSQQQAGTQAPYDATRPPRPEDFGYTDENGNFVRDTSAYLDAYDQWMTIRIKEKQLADAEDQGLSSYMDDVVNQLQLEISAGNLSVNKANTILQARTSSYQNALQAYSSEAFKYGAPAGAQYVPGRAPGDYLVSKLGMSPLPAQQGVINPMQEAIDTLAQAQSTVGSIQVPTIPNLAGVRAGGAPPSAQPAPSGGSTGAGPPQNAGQQSVFQQALAALQQQRATELEAVEFGG